MPGLEDLLLRHRSQRKRKSIRVKHSSISFPSRQLRRGTCHQTREWISSNSIKKILSFQTFTIEAVVKHEVEAEVVERTNGSRSSTKSTSICLSTTLEILLLSSKEQSPINSKPRTSYLNQIENMVCKVKQTWPTELVNIFVKIC